MGCDGFIKDKLTPTAVYLICYECGDDVKIDPVEGHESCWSIGPNGEDYLRVNVEIDNYECR